MNDIEQYEKRKECRHFNDCSAPFCPVAMNTGAVWLSEDEICSSHDFKDSIIIPSFLDLLSMAGSTFLSIVLMFDFP